MIFLHFFCMIDGSFIEISKARNEENPGSTGVGTKILWML